MSQSNCINCEEVNLSFNFCQYWPMAKMVLSGLEGNIKSKAFQAAIAAFIAAADSYCTDSRSTDLARLNRYGIKAEGAEAEYLETLSDSELEVLGKVQRQLKANKLVPADGVGSGLF